MLARPISTLLNNLTVSMLFYPISQRETRLILRFQATNRCIGLGHLMRALKNLMESRLGPPPSSLVRRGLRSLLPWFIKRATFAKRLPFCRSLYRPLGLIQITISI